GERLVGLADRGHVDVAEILNRHLAQLFERLRLHLWTHPQSGDESRAYCAFPEFTGCGSAQRSHEAPPLARLPFAASEEQNLRGVRSFRSPEGSGDAKRGALRQMTRILLVEDEMLVRELALDDLA